jgi:Cu/Ag efflux protein CusF
MKNLLAIILSLILISSAVAAMNQLGPRSASDPDTIYQTLRGTVANASNNVLTLMQDPPRKDKLIEAMHFQVNDKTEYKEIKSFKQLKAGDQVEVSFKDKDGQKVATSIIKLGSAPNPE